MNPAAVCVNSTQEALVFATNAVTVKFSDQKVKKTMNEQEYKRKQANLIASQEDLKKELDALPKTKSYARLRDKVQGMLEDLDDLIIENRLEFNDSERLRKRKAGEEVEPLSRRCECGFTAHGLTRKDLEDSMVEHKVRSKKHDTDTLNTTPQQ